MTDSRNSMSLRGLPPRVTVPHSVAEERVLAHNHIQHTIDMPCGVNGFRSWTWPKGKQPRDLLARRLWLCRLAVTRASLSRREEMIVET
jgi:hypothetical protein